MSYVQLCRILLQAVKKEQKKLYVRSANEMRCRRAVPWAQVYFKKCTSKPLLIDSRGKLEKKILGEKREIPGILGGGDM